jgi:PAS domain S-box-containing protein
MAAIAPFRCRPASLIALSHVRGVGTGARFLYNDAYAEILGDKHPDALGGRFRDIWAEIWPDISPLIDAAMAGEATYRENLPLVMHRRGFDEQTFFTFSYSPVRDEHGQVAGMFCACTETTQQVLSQKRQQFRLSLEERLRDLTEPSDIMTAAAATVGGWLGAARAGYGEAEDDGAHVIVEREWVNGDARPLNGRYRLEDYGSELLPAARAGQAIRIEDALTDPGLREAGAALADLGIRSSLTIPLNKAGRLVSLLYVNRPDPHRWTDYDEAIAREVADRTWAVVERARAEKALRSSTDALRASEQQFRLLADSSPALIWVTDENAQVTFANKRYEEVFGHPAEAIEGEGWRSIVHPDDVEVFNARFLSALAARERFVGEVRVQDRAGNLMWLHCEGVPRFDPNGRLLGYVGANLDITQAKLAEEQLRQINETLEHRVASALAERHLFADFVDSTPAAILACDLDFNVLAANPALVAEFERLYGCTIKLGDNLLRLLGDRPEHRDQVASFWARALAGEEFVIAEQFGDPGREQRHYEVRFHTIRDRAGRQIGAFQAAFDVTERVRAAAELAEAQDALRQAQKMEAMGQLTGGVAHDVNNLLSPIVGGLDLVQRKGLGGEREQRLIAGALASAERVRVLVQRLLAFARRQPLQPQPVDVGALVAGMADLLASTSGPQIKIAVQAADDLPAAIADPNQLEMAILNLAVNARDAMPDGGKLTISARPLRLDSGLPSGPGPGNYVRLVVADTGTGMDADTLKRAVEPFFSTKGIGKGTGLGLSMAHGLAAQLGGALTIDSKPGLGTSVELWLPATERSDKSITEVGKPDAIVAGGGTALLVDDEELVRSSTADMLTDLGYTVAEAVSAEEALRLIDAGLQPDVVVTDHLMPGMTGTALAHELRERLPGTPTLWYLAMQTWKVLRPISPGWSSRSGRQTSPPVLKLWALPADFGGGSFQVAARISLTSASSA